MSGLKQNQVLLASNNSGKLVELSLLLGDVGLTAVKLAEVPALVDLPEPVETGLTFQANALLKAKFYSEYWSGPILADDSGLEVAALNNEPGVKSNRWLAGTDQTRNQGILTRLQGVKERSAKFITVICWLESPEVEPIFFRGEVAGEIALVLAGTAGFGYDPIFQPDGFKKTFAELGIELKNKLSHRAKALAQLKAFLTAKT